MHLSVNEGIEGKTFVVTGGLGFVGSALCSELVRRGALQVRTLDPRPSSPWSDDLKKFGVHCVRGTLLLYRLISLALMTNFSTQGFLDSVKSIINEYYRIFCF